MKRSLLGALWDRLGGGSETVTPGPSERLRLSGKAIRIPFQGLALPGPCFEVEMGRQRLRMYPDLALDTSHREGPLAFLVFDPQRYLSGLGHFLRLAPGESLAISHGAEDQRRLFSHPRDAFRRHFQVRHEGDALVFRDPISELGTYLSMLEDGSEEELVHRRRQSLERVAEIFGGPLEPLPAATALTTLQEVNHLLRDAAYRPKDGDGNAGGLLELPERLTPVVVGDLHATVDNLLKILSENRLLERLDRGDACLLLLGDAVHPEAEAQVHEMDSSVLIMDLVFKLMLQFPAQMFFLLGNHDSFATEVMKYGVPQGLLWRKRLHELRGLEYVEQMELFYRSSPLVAVAKSFVACHAGPPRAKTPRETLVDVRRHPGLVHELTWTRARTLAQPAGYSQADVNRFRKSLGVGKNTPLIVGHYPVSAGQTVWLNARRIQNHHVVFSARADQVGSMVEIEGEIVPHVYPAEPLLDWIKRQQLYTIRRGRPSSSRRI